MVKKRLCIYILEEVWKDFLQICKREGMNGSQKLEMFMQTYNQEHKVGNPQLLIVHYVKPEQPQPMRVLCVFCQGATSDGRVFCQKKEMWIGGVKCYSCKFNKLRKNG